MMHRPLGVVLLVGTLVLPPLASANAFDNLKRGASGLMNSSDAAQNAAGGGALLRQLGSGSFNLVSMQNVAGVLGYCQKQGYTQGAAERVKNSLLSKLGGQSQVEESADYQQGLAGVLKGGQGNHLNLADLKDRLGTRVCGAVADRAVSSFLGS